ncbi:SLC13 family permease [Sphingomicrobium astaxanthinifaciens]|uniref:SLC13 family permease n=1 Tax=Sphingomicrobium astaxanthinifaciens TaxID=1227949 RepID=UPI001FCAAF5D|nr:SLC13 family permease [Sphingomicrobium astaxanthinifaciens]MCJ7421243.1 SLC13 family permease [Sphingomicrobium astaxanthinifaciens]
MLSLPSLHAALAIMVATLMFAAFASNRFKVEIISLMTIGAIALMLYLIPLPQTNPKDGLALAFGGFGHTALVTICALMVMGRGLVVTGALEPAARALGSVFRVNTHVGLLVTLVLAMFASMVVNDTPVLVLLIPVMVQLAAGGAMPASKTLIPLNAAILIGGMATTIGTSTNLLVVSIAADLGMQELPIFHFTPIVLTAALVCLPYIWLVMPRLLPDNSPEAGHEPRKFIATLRVGTGSSWLERAYDDFKDKLPETFAFLREPRTLQPGQRLAAVATADGLREAARKLGATAAPRWLIERLGKESAATGEDLVEAEMAISGDSRLVGRTLQTAGIRGVAVLGVAQAPSRGFAAPREMSAEARLAEGDILLVLGRESALQEFAQNDALLMLDGARPLPRRRKAWTAILIMGTAVLLASLGIVPIAISALAGAVAMFVTGCVHFDKVGRALSAKVIVLVAASIAIGRLIADSGAAQWLGEILAFGMSGLAPPFVLALIMLFVTLLTNFASNATAAAVGTPIAFSLAGQLGLEVEPLVLAVLFGCNLCYATPIAYQTNMLIMAEGDYRFNDYLKTGIPLVLLMVASLSVVLSITYGL